MTELRYKITTEYGGTEITDYAQAMECKENGATVEKVFKEHKRELTEEELARRNRRLQHFGYKV